MNAAIRRELDRPNEAPMACGESRRAIFEANEATIGNFRHESDRLFP